MMEFLNKIFAKRKSEEERLGNKINVEKEGLKKLGEIDKCPYCKKRLEKIPSRKKKCEFCGEYIYVRSRPFDREQVLVTKEQADEIEEQWKIHYLVKEETKLSQDPEFVQTRKELTQKFGKKASINDVKWDLYNKRIIEFASTKKWGLYRCNKFDMACLLKKEGKLNQALENLFEVCYLDLNGSMNIGHVSDDIASVKWREEMEIKEFSSRMAFLAPGIISMIVDLMADINMTKSKAKEIFFKVSEERKPYKTMSISTKEAWDKVNKELISHKEYRRKINEFNPEDLNCALKEIKLTINEEDIQILSEMRYKLRAYYNTKKKIQANQDKLRIILKELLSANNSSIKEIGESLLSYFIKKDANAFAYIVKD